MMSPLAQLFEFGKKTGRPASFGSPHGRYPFFTSSPELSKWTDVPDCEGPALVFGTGGSASLHYVEGPFSATNDCYVACPKSGNAEEAKFFYYFLKENIHVIENGFRGAGLKHVSKKYLESIMLPTGQRTDRSKVVLTLDKADAIRRKREQALEMSDDFFKSVFLQMFGDPVSNSKGLSTKPLSWFGEIVTGNTPPRSNPENYGRFIEWIKSDNINTPMHFLTEAKEFLSEKGAKLGRTVPRGSILVICIAGSPASIGRAAVADRDVALNQQINAIIPNQDVDHLFLYAQFLVGQRLVQAASTNSMKGMVSKGKFKEIQFLAPEPYEQRKFGEIFRKYLENSTKLISAHNASQDLYSSLSQRAFRAEL